MKAPRLRFAPSPSGFLHIGGARTALFCWLLARRHGGQFVLRVEDTDATRTTDASIQAILDGLTWLGLDWDEGPGVGGPVGPYFQSQRKDIYRAHVDRLLASGVAYRCVCSAEELAEKRDRAMTEGRKPIYDRTCRDLDLPATDAPHVIRLKAPLDGEVVVHDLIRGDVVFRNEELGDQVIVRTNGDPLYNFVVVVDDATMGITHVVRGDDHLANTPKQLHLYEAFGWDPPAFAHCPLILGGDRKRLSKRHGATDVMSYAQDGYLPDAMVNFLVRLGWSHGDQEIFTRQEMIDAFAVEAVGRSPGVWNPEKLLWLNGHYINQLPTAALAELVSPRIRDAGYPDHQVDAVLVRRLDTLKERAKTLAELVELGTFYWSAADDLEYTDEKASRKFLKAASAPHLERALAALDATAEWTEPALHAAIEGLIEELGVTIGKLAQPIRVAVTGTSASPGIFETLAALGRDKTLRRIARAIPVARANQPAEG